MRCGVVDPLTNDGITHDACLSFLPALIDADLLIFLFCIKKSSLLPLRVRRDQTCASEFWNIPCL